MLVPRTEFEITPIRLVTSIHNAIMGGQKYNLAGFHPEFLQKRTLAISASKTELLQQASGSMRICWSYIR